jgi:hypothetical protein
VAQADTILAWHRKFATQTVDTSTPHQSVSRPRVAPEIEDWVIRMARENRSWGYDRIQGSLNHLGYTISDQTVAEEAVADARQLRSRPLRNRQRFCGPPYGIYHEAA